MVVVNNALSSGNCKKDCKEEGEFYVESSNSCQSCHENCLTCKGANRLDCLSCGPGSRLRILNQGASSGDCRKGCQAEGEDYIESSNTCGKCSLNCLACEGGGQKECSSCSPGYRLVKEDATDPLGECKEGCPDGQWQDQSLSCHNCQAPCELCVGSTAYSCLSCKPGHQYISQLKYCREICQRNEFYDSDKLACAGCHQSCGTCKNGLETGCVTCATSGLELTRDGKCLAPCTNNQYRDTDDSCKPCHQWCRSCFGSTNKHCFGCSDPNFEFLGDQSYCRPKCDPKTYRENDQCRPCHPSCLTCTGEGPNSCSRCPPNFELAAGQCSCL